MTAVHFIVPAGIDDASRPSGGNAYDLRISRGLAAAGWIVHMHEVPGAWPSPDTRSRAVLASAVDGIPDGDLVLLDGLVTSPAAEVLQSHVGRLRLVVLVHMPLGHSTTKGDLQAKEGALLSAAESVVTTSNWARRVLLGLYSLSSDRVHVAEPGVDPAELAPGTATAGSLLSVAAVIPAKGHDVLVEALASLTGFRWQCQCIGSLERDPAFVQRLRRRIFESGMDGRVQFPGPQAEADLSHSYASSDLLVLPSRAESYGMVIVEALARALPVVAAEVGGAPEALGCGADGTRPGLLVPAGDPASLRDALRSWLEDAGLRLRLRAAARERRASLPDWSATISAFAQTLQEAAR
jgi:glycosyltransferase involved in cell wall biosynthesis